MKVIKKKVGQGGTWKKRELGERFRSFLFQIFLVICCPESKINCAIVRVNVCLKSQSISWTSGRCDECGDLFILHQTWCMNSGIHSCCRRAGASSMQANLKKCYSWVSFQSSRTPSFGTCYVLIKKMVNLWDAPQGLAKARCHIPTRGGSGPTHESSFISSTCNTCARVADTTRASKLQFSCSGFFFYASSSSRGGFSAHFAQCSYAPE